MTLRRYSAESSGGSENNSVVADCSLKKKFPTVCEFISLAKWPDGSSRETGTIILCQEGGRLKACLSDRDAGVVAFVSAKSFTGLLEAMEAGLTGDGLDWRLNRAQAARTRGRA